jgi:SAM-dependent methyltransferase
MTRIRFLNFARKEYFPKAGKALDLGCHVGNESRELLSRGFEVDGVDVQDISNITNEHFRFRQSDIKDFKIKPDAHDIILAYYVLPFLKEKELVQKAVSDIRGGLKKDGIAIITLFGKEHEWFKNGKGKHAYFTLEEAKEIIGAYIDIQTKEEMSDTMNGQRIFWQSWDFVIKK